MALSLRSIFDAVTAAVTGFFGFLFGFFRRSQLEPDELRGKNVVITGATAGIGEQMAYYYARHGAKVFLISRRENILEMVAKKCRQLGAAQAAYYATDLGIAENISGVVKAISRNFDSLDHLILNHKLENHIMAWTGNQQDLKQLDDIFQTNFFGYVRLASALVPFLEKRSGTIGVVSSAAGRSSNPYLASYASSKHALDGFFNGWSLELQEVKSPVSVTYITLGLIDTENMRKELREFDFANLKLLLSGAANVTDTAEAIVTAVARKRRELYYPWAVTRIPLIFRFWFPQLFDKMNGFILRSKRA